MRPENQRMKEFLAANGIVATPKYLFAGSLKRTWRLYNKAQKWTPELAAQLTALGFTNHMGQPCDRFEGNGGMFCVFVRGHYELVNGSE